MYPRPGKFCRALQSANAPMHARASGRLGSRISNPAKAGESRLVNQLWFPTSQLFVRPPALSPPVAMLVPVGVTRPNRVGRVIDRHGFFVQIFSFQRELVAGALNCVQPVERLLHKGLTSILGLFFTELSTAVLKITSDLIKERS